jgi:hypothetical protein
LSRDVEQITAHATLALARLVEQYKGKPLFAALLNCITPQVQQIENLFISIRDGLRLASAVGAQLDILGRVVGQAREASNDTDYRARIGARIKANLSTGSTESIFAVFSLLLPGHTLEIKPYYPAEFVLNVFGATDSALTPLYARFLADTKAGGVRGQGVYSLNSDATTFTFSEVGAPNDINLGFGNNAQTTGAHLGGIF